MTALTHDEGAELLPVLVDRVAADAGVRVLLVKGVAASHHGLREPRRSSDVDVLVEPGAFAELVSSLVGLGWARVDEGVPTVAPSWETTTLRHEVWPIELDLHGSFPGILAPAGTAFDALWAERSSIPLAGQAVAATGWAGTALILGLHALRGRTEALAPELAQLLVRVQGADAERRGALVALAEALGADSTAAEVVEAAGGQPGPIRPEHERASRDWRMLHGEGSSVGVAWLMQFRRTPFWGWPMLVFRALMGGSEAALRYRYPEAPAGRLGLWRARWWRLKETLPQLPAAVRRVLRRR
ncbi:nucleotidyltransferase family protein [Nocardioides jejuensis]|uniref:Nucleotidyltransferase family protein n=1 Tax=Nocardioides jejuensis TaxID=2502782 RepID=A0A4R1CHJ6_9ACTN|nr:nucleotidyltransferase family protein [Nocardioides jejuensis]TCJ30227.1 hypothetical protein EPD65_04905 [Nocardioides jejuensis]